MDNPLKRYFRRPSLYFKLPSLGKLYDSSVVDMPPNQELPVYPMTANDEIIVRNPDALFNGAAMVELIKSCMPNIKDPWKINSIDFDAILIAIRAASVGNQMEIESKCPSCSETGTYGVNLVALLSKQVNINYDETLKIRELEIKFRPLVYSELNQNQLDQNEIQRMLAALEDYDNSPEQQKMMTEAVNRMNQLVIGTVASTIEYIKTPETVVTEQDFILEFMNGCDKQTSTTIREHSLKLKEANEIPPMNVKCIHCSHDYTNRVILNSSDFFE
jgi:hypothetical protein